MAWNSEARSNLQQAGAEGLSGGWVEQRRRRDHVRRGGHGDVGRAAARGGRVRRDAEDARECGAHFWKEALGVSIAGEGSGLGRLTVEEARKAEANFDIAVQTRLE
jgi:hypothetical protein